MKQRSVYWFHLLVDIGHMHVFVPTLHFVFLSLCLALPFDQILILKCILFL